MHTVVGLQDHTCNAWCTPPRHSHLVLVTPEADAEAIVHGGVAEAYYVLRKRRILSAREATEVDKAAGVRDKHRQSGISTRLTVRTFTPEQLAQLRCWLIVFEQETD